MPASEPFIKKDVLEPTRMPTLFVGGPWDARLLIVPENAIQNGKFIAQTPENKANPQHNYFKHVLPGEYGIEFTVLRHETLTINAAMNRLFSTYFKSTPQMRPTAP